MKLLYTMLECTPVHPVLRKLLLAILKKLEEQDERLERLEEIQKDGS